MSKSYPTRPSDAPEIRAKYRAKYSAQHAERHTEEFYAECLSDAQRVKRCCQCGDKKHVSLFCKNRRRPDGFRSECKACQAFNKRRAPKGVSDALRWEVWERDNFTCQKCGYRRFLAIDHIKPRVLGGSDDATNLQTLCRSCNASKDAATRKEVSSV